MKQTPDNCYISQKIQSKQTGKVVLILMFKFYAILKKVGSLYRCEVKIKITFLAGFLGASKVRKRRMKRWYCNVLRKDSFNPKCNLP
jgi:hypothetical protein